MSKNPLTAGQGQQMPNLNEMYNKFRENPIEWLLKAKLNIPQELSGSPQAMVEHLMRTNQIPQQLMPQIKNMMPKN